jgi:hypothetical protein
MQYKWNQQLKHTIADYMQPYIPDEIMMNIMLYLKMCDIIKIPNYSRIIKKYRKAFHTLAVNMISDCYDKHLKYMSFKRTTYRGADWNDCWLKFITMHPHQYRLKISNGDTLGNSISRLCRFTPYFYIDFDFIRRSHLSVERESTYVAHIVRMSDCLSGVQIIPKPKKAKYYVTMMGKDFEVLHSELKNMRILIGAIYYGDVLIKIKTYDDDTTYKAKIKYNVLPVCVSRYYSRCGVVIEAERYTTRYMSGIADIALNSTLV